MNTLQKALLVFCCQVISFSAFSQLSQISFKIGANVSTVHNDNLIDNRFSLGMESGFGGRFTINPHKGANLFVNLEMLSSRRGYKQVYGQEDYKVILYYLAFPVTLVYSPIDFLSLDAGLEYNALIHARWSDGNEKIKVRENYQSSDWGLVAGMTFFQNRRLCGFVRYAYGLKDILEYSAVDNFGNLEKGKKDFNNRSIQFGIKVNIDVE